MAPHITMEAWDLKNDQEVFGGAEDAPADEDTDDQEEDEDPDWSDESNYYKYD